MASDGPPVYDAKVHPAPPPPPSYEFNTQYSEPISGGAVVVTQQPMLVISNFNTASPVQCQCMYCRNYIVTNVRYEVGLITWFAAGFICLIGCGIFAWIPCLINDMKNVVHTCPNCGKVNGIYNRGL
ncbi:lipopolysaccharide-induced tumor necrosis factor-alpha factor homolog [Styela clava]